MKSIELKNVSKLYNKDVCALNNVSFTVNQVEFVVVTDSL